MAAGVAAEHSIPDRILLPEEVRDNVFLKNDFDSEKIMFNGMEQNIEVVRANSESKLLLNVENNRVKPKNTTKLNLTGSVDFKNIVSVFTDLKIPIVELEMGHINVKNYFPVLERELDILPLSNNDKSYILKKTVHSIPKFGKNDVRQWSPRKVILYLHLICSVPLPANNLNCATGQQSIYFGHFLKQLMTGQALLMLFPSELMGLLEDHETSYALTIYGAILILRKYSFIFFKETFYINNLNT